MITSFLLIVILSLPFLLMRMLRWMALVQQKEYRFDRIWLFLTTPAGQREIFYFPAFQDFRRTKLKRPVLTYRILIIGGISSLLLALFVSYSFIWFDNHLDLLIYLVVVYLLIPLIVWVSMLATSLPKYILTFAVTKMAKEKVKSKKPLIIGITGSYGKSSTRFLLAHILSEKYSVFTPPRSFNTKFSIAMSVLKNFHDHDVVLLEYGAYRKGEIAELTHYFPPKIAMVTGITPQHVGLFESMENLLKAKAELIQSLSKDGVVFVNADDPKAVELCLQSKQTVIEYSAKTTKKVIQQPCLNSNGYIELVYQGKKVTTKLVGMHYLQNIVGAITVAKHLHIQTEKIVSSLSSFVPNELFVRIGHHPSGATIIDDSGTSNPKGFEAAIAIVKHLKKAKNILIFSGIVDLSNDSHEIHMELAKKSGAVFQKVIYSGKDGVEEFREIFDQELIENDMGISDLINGLDKNTLILLEGRLPKHLYALLKGKCDETTI